MKAPPVVERVAQGWLRVRQRPVGPLVTGPVRTFWRQRQERTVTYSALGDSLRTLAWYVWGLLLGQGLSHQGWRWLTVVTVLMVLGVLATEAWDQNRRGGDRRRRRERLAAEREIIEFLTRANGTARRPVGVQVLVEERGPDGETLWH